MTIYSKTYDQTIAVMAEAPKFNVAKSAYV